jgi:hypothetical protein
MHAFGLQHGLVKLFRRRVLAGLMERDRTLKCFGKVTPVTRSPSCRMLRHDEIPLLHQLPGRRPIARPA